MATNAKPRRIGSLATYHLLGRSGLRVSPLCLGAMTFGEDWGWGAPEEAVRKILDRYLEAGGNFIDTADGYTDGHSEEILGRYCKAKKNREGVVLATKFTFNSQPGDPNAGGNGRKNILRALEGSLRRLRTDAVDLYWLHAWDMLTPVEEVMATIDTLVRAGKVRYFGLSAVPAWYLARAQTIAELRGTEPVCALQLEYSLVERTIEREHVPAALELGMGVCPWSPLASGLLTGKYKPARGGVKGTGRLATAGGARFSKATERNWAIVGEVLAVARELGRSPAQVALNWVTKRRGVASTIIGATTLAQLEDNLAALEFEIPEGPASRLEAVSRPEPAFPYYFFGDEMQNRLRGGVPVSAEPPWFRRR
ncbi:MAG: aldo/keto reductase [Thermoanaerobaculaceae bacterium]|jgi:aryl-alcohol dehydrogenase-like predicted oxidoreductase